MARSRSASSVSTFARSSKQKARFLQRPWKPEEDQRLALLVRRAQEPPELPLNGLPTSARASGCPSPKPGPRATLVGISASGKDHGPPHPEKGNSLRPRPSRRERVGCTGPSRRKVPGLMQRTSARGILCTVILRSLPANDPDARTVTSTVAPRRHLPRWLPRSPAGRSERVPVVGYSQFGACRCPRWQLHRRARWRPQPGHLQPGTIGQGERQPGGPELFALFRWDQSGLRRLRAPLGQLQGHGGGFGPVLGLRHLPANG